MLGQLPSAALLSIESAALARAAERQGLLGRSAARDLLGESIRSSVELASLLVERGLLERSQTAALQGELSILRTVCSTCLVIAPCDCSPR